jgi:hypothetical protein
VKYVEFEEVGHPPQSTDLGIDLAFYFIQRFEKQAISGMIFN